MVNPTENIMVRVKNGDVKILAVPEVRQLSSAAQACERPASVIPYLAVQLFAGLRPFEAARLRWERIGFDTGQISRSWANKSLKACVPYAIPMRQREREDRKMISIVQ
jgi:hypothetical protein